ncbi:MAG TPA: dihydrofolate reductase family protein [Candidatus Limnocylindrales bacterium]|nr:dihydrofolate reductase family protein [Candidatus Limnocylindrales bacterium]
MADEPTPGLPAPLEPLWAAGPPGPPGERRGAPMPDDLRSVYGGLLTLPLADGRPTVVANFVSTVDGVVALDRVQGSGGGEISGFDRHDRFVMGLLRSLADAVLVAAGTVRAAPNHHWTARHVFRAAAPTFADWRSRLELAPQPTTIIVTGSGDLDPGHPALHEPDVPVIIATTEPGARHLRRGGLPDHVRIEVLASGVGDRSGGRLAPAAILALVASTGARITLCEGGPRLFAQLLRADLVDELFLTLAPQIAGRTVQDERLALVEGAAFAPQASLWMDLRSVRRGGGHLFLEYGLVPGVRAGGLADPT